MSTLVAASSWASTAMETSSNRSKSATPGTITRAGWTSTVRPSGFRAPSTDPTRRRACTAYNLGKHRNAHSMSTTTSVLWRAAGRTATSSVGRGDRDGSIDGRSTVTCRRSASIPASSSITRTVSGLTQATCCAAALPRLPSPRGLVGWEESVCSTSTPC